MEQGGFVDDEQSADGPVQDGHQTWHLKTEPLGITQK